MERIKSYLFGFVVIFFLVVLIQNSSFIFGSVPFTFLMWTQNVSIIILLIAAGLFGYLTAMVKGYFKHKKHERVALEKQKKKLAAEKKEIASYDE